jgi:hypothetical protein
MKEKKIEINSSKIKSIWILGNSDFLCLVFYEKNSLFDSVPGKKLSWGTREHLKTKKIRKKINDMTCTG